MAYLDDETPVLDRNRVVAESAIPEPPPSPVAEAPIPPAPAGPVAEAAIPPAPSTPEAPAGAIERSPVADIAAEPAPPTPAPPPATPPAEGPVVAEAPIPIPTFKGTRGKSAAIAQDEELPDHKPRTYRPEALQAIEETDPSLFRALNQVGKDTKVSPYDLALLVKLRSGVDPEYRGEDGRVGYFGISPEEAKLLDPRGEFDVNNPIHNLYLGAAKWRHVQSEFGRGSDNAFAAFFAGDDVVNRMLSRPEDQQAIVNADAPGLWEFLDRVKGFDAPDRLTPGARASADIPPAERAGRVAGAVAAARGPVVAEAQIPVAEAAIPPAEQPSPRPGLPPGTEPPTAISPPEQPSPRPGLPPGTVAPTAISPPEQPALRPGLPEGTEPPIARQPAPMNDVSGVTEQPTPRPGLPANMTEPPVLGSAVPGQPPPPGYTGPLTRQGLVPTSISGSLSWLAPLVPAPSRAGGTGGGRLRAAPPDSDLGPNAPAPALDDLGQPSTPGAASPALARPGAAAATTEPDIADQYRNAKKLGYKGTQEQFAREQSARNRAAESPDLGGGAAAPTTEDADLQGGTTRPAISRAAPTPAGAPAPAAAAAPAAPAAPASGTSTPPPPPAGTVPVATPPASAAGAIVPAGAPAGVAPTGRALEGTTNNITIQGAVRAAQQGGPPGLMAYAADGAPRGMSMGNVWDNLENKMFQLAILTADAGQLMHMREWLFQYRHSGMYDNLRKAYAFMDKDPVAAMNHLAASHAFVQDGTILQMGINKQGQIVGQRYDEDTHKPMGNLVPIDKEMVRKMMNLSSDPQKYAQTENAERQTNSTIAHQQVTEAQADQRLAWEREKAQYEAQRAADLKQYEQQEANRRHQETVQTQLHNAAQSRQIAIEQANATREANSAKAAETAATRTAGIDKEIDTRFGQEAPKFMNADGTEFTSQQKALASQYYKAVRMANPEGNAETAMEAARGMSTNLDKSGKKENKKTALHLEPFQVNGTTYLGLVAEDGRRVAYVAPESLRGMGIPQVDQMLPATRPERQVPHVQSITVPPAPVLQPTRQVPAPPAMAPLPPRLPSREREPLRY